MNVLFSRFFIPILEILILTFFFYQFLKYTIGVRKPALIKSLGVLSILFAMFACVIIADYLRFYRLELVIREWFIPLFVLSLLIIFNPELRRAAISVGQKSPISKYVFQKPDVIYEVIDAVETMSKNKIGALIAFERDVPLDMYKENATKLDSYVTSELLQTVFHPRTILHDGAVIIKGDRIVAAACFFPYSDNPDISKVYGSRHRAALGITEETDAVTVVTSEETGQISMTSAGKLINLPDRDTLEKTLRDLLYQVPSAKETKDIEKKKIPEQDKKDL